MASIGLMPVINGSLTGWRATTPGALNSAGRVSFVWLSPLPSSGRPSGSTMRPSSSSPTGTSSRRPVRLTLSPSSISSQGPNRTVPTLSDSRPSARPVTSCGSSSSSIDMQLSRPWTREMPSATDRTVPTSERSAPPSSSPSMRLLRMLVISSGLICTASPYLLLRGPLDLLPKLFQSVADARVEDHVPYPEHEPAKYVGVDPRGQLDAAPGLVLDALADRLHEPLVEFHGARHGHRQEPVLLGPHGFVGTPDAVDDRHAVALREQLEKADHVLVGPLDHARDAVLLLLRGEVGREEEQPQLTVLLERVGELPELVVDAVHDVVLLRHLEQGALVLLVERLARDLLGGDHGERRHLAADVVDRPARLGVDVAAGGLHQLLPLLARLRAGTLALRVGILARPHDDVLGLLARLLQPRPVLLEQLVRLAPGALGGVDRVRDRLGAAVERLPDPREGDSVKQVERDAERDQRPDHEPHVGADEEAAAAGVLCREDQHQRKNAIRPKMKA